MKVFAIALDRSKERKKYIQQHLLDLKLDSVLIDAVDGSTLSQIDIESCCDMEQVNKLRWWLTDGAIGCALSHYNAYKEIIRTDQKAGLIIEDDVVLPPNIHEVLDDIEKHIGENEVILLYYTSFKPCKLSNIGASELRTGKLVYPINIEQAITATAYVIGRIAAQRMVDNIKPIKVTADSWYHYYGLGCFDSFRVHYPAITKTKNFKSSIDYLEKGSIKAHISNYVNKYKIPVIYQVLKFLRARRLNVMLGHFNLTNEPSPIYQKRIIFSDKL
jgi:glycosyl transferase family 25